jgi:methanogenic corrinoid protein MtbC1
MNPEAANNAVNEKMYQRYLAALLAGERHQCRAIFESLLEGGIELRRIYQDLIQRSLYEVGAMWERGRASVATEHIATAITESLFGLAYPRLFNHPRTGRSAVVSCGANEYHQVGGKIVADLFELNGWRGYFLGANTPAKGLLDFINNKKPDVVALSSTVYFNLENLLKTAAAIRIEFPEVPIIVGGQAFHCSGRARAERIAGVRCIVSLDELDSWIKSSHGH